MKFSKTTGSFYPEEINYKSFPDDIIEVSDADYQLAVIRKPGETIDIKNNKIVIVPAPVVLPGAEMYVYAVQAALDTKARERNYEGILSLCTYANSENVTFKAEGKAGVVWRDTAWDYCYKTLDNVQKGKRTQPTIEAFIAELPKMDWAK